MRFRNNNGGSGAAVITPENVEDNKEQSDERLTELTESQESSSQESDDGSLPNGSASPSSHPRTRKRIKPPKFTNFYVIVSGVIALGLTVTLILNFWPVTFEVEEIPGLDVREYNYQSQVVVNDLQPLPNPRDEACLFHNCFDIYRCGYSDNDKIKVYIYPPTNYVDENGVPIKEPFSKEFKELVQAIADSEYHTYDPDKACLFIPSIDMLNQNSIRTEETGRLLASLP